MRHYKLKEGERGPFTELFVITKADLAVGFNDQQIQLSAINEGDIIYPVLLLERKAALSGPTGAPTISIGIPGFPEQFLAVDAFNANAWRVPDEAIAPFASNGLVFLIADLQAGAGDGAAPTAGEMWVWMCISRAGDRAHQA